MDNTRGDGNRNNNSEMEDEFNNCIDDKVCVYETIITGGFIKEELCDAKNKQKSIDNYVAVKDENMDDQTVIDLTDEHLCDTEYKQENIHNYVSLKDESIDDLHVIIPETELKTDCTDDKLCSNETIISGGYIKQELRDVKDEPRSIQNYLNIKDENIDGLTVGVQETELMTDCMDNKVCIDETIISGGYIKNKPYEPGNESGNIHNNIDMNGCEECGEEYDLYCLKCQCNNNGEMEAKFDNCTDDKVCVYETIITGGFIKEELCDARNKQESIDTYVAVKDENMDDQTVIDLTEEHLCDTEYKQENIHNCVSLKDESIDDLHVIIPETELKTDCTDDKLCSNKTLISEVYIKQEPGDMKDEQGSIQYYSNIKDENIDDLMVVVEETELMPDCIDNKVYINETIISAGYIKKEPGDESGSIHNNINMKGCEECGEKYDLYCLKCSMLIRIFDSNNLDRIDDTVRRTLPKNFIDICEPQSGMGVVALRAIPEGVVFGPFKGVDSIKDDVISKWKLQNNELAVSKDSKRLNWMQYIRRADKISRQNLVPFQYNDGLYYRSESRINMGDELLVHWDIDDKETGDQDMEDSYWEPQIYESLDDSYTCTFCCVGYKSISHLKAHNSTCVEKRNKKDFCKEIVQCDICKIYLDKKEYSDYHMDRCYKSNGKSVFNSCCRRNRDRPLHNGDRSFWCTLCPYKAKTKSRLKIHIAIHTGDKPFACTLCPYKTTSNSFLKRHMVVHNHDRSFACSICPYKTKTKSSLNHHIVIHNGDKPFACTLCPYKTKTKSSLNQHIVIHNGDKPFTCTLCPYKSTRKSSLKQHIAIHNDDRPFPCTLCPYKAASKAILKQHLSNHNGERRKSNLKQHIAMHTGDKPFACTLCPYKTTSNYDLKQHMAVHNSDRPFPCTLCSYEAATKSKLKQHIVKHNGDKPFACTLCPYKTNRRRSLQTHIIFRHFWKTQRT